MPIIHKNNLTFLHFFLTSGKKAYKQLPYHITRTKAAFVKIYTLINNIIKRTYQPNINISNFQDCQQAVYPPELDPRGPNTTGKTVLATGNNVTGNKATVKIHHKAGKSAFTDKITDTRNFNAGNYIYIPANKHSSQDKKSGTQGTHRNISNIHYTSNVAGRATSIYPSSAPVDTYLHVDHLHTPTKLHASKDSTQLNLTGKLYNLVCPKTSIIRTNNSTFLHFYMKSGKNAYTQFSSYIISTKAVFDKIYMPINNTTKPTH